MIAFNCDAPGPTRQSRESKCAITESLQLNLRKVQELCLREASGAGGAECLQG